MMTMLQADLSMTKILLDGSTHPGELRALVCDACVRRNVMTELLADLGFERDGAGPHWVLRRRSGRPSWSSRDVFDILEPIAVWYVGAIFAAGTGTPVFDRSKVPIEWGGAVALGVRSTGHCVLFTPDASEQDLRARYDETYRRYLIGEFHPAE